MSLSYEDPREKHISGKETNEGKESEVEKQTLLSISKPNPSSGTHIEPLPS